MRYFNTEGCCKPQIHYMVRLDDRLEQIKRLYVDRGKYVVLNRGRQYGKTTTLMALAQFLKSEYLVLSMDFQCIGTEEFADASSFVRAFASMAKGALKKAETGNGTKLAELLEQFAPGSKKRTLRELFAVFSRICEKADRRVVLIIDEVDSASNNQVFVDFLAQLRVYYLNREERPVFYSVILAGVYDIKNLKLKIRPDAERQYNSPWNVAAKFSLPMSFSPSQIRAMLAEYEADMQTGMDIEAAAQYIYQYTAGYPYLVSVVCKYLDEEIPYRTQLEGAACVWTKNGIAEAVKLLLKENVPLFDSMVKQLDLYENLRSMIQQMLYQGKAIPYSPAEKSIRLGVMFGFLKEENGRVAIANRIFEMFLLNLFLAEESVRSRAYQYGERDKNQFLTDGRLNMRLVLEKFVIHFSDIYGRNDDAFIEENGRRFFLLYLKPIINGVGNYYLEAQTRDARRTDVIVDYRGEQFIVELKIWHGNEYNQRGERQLADYLDAYHQKEGYLVSFNFNQKKETGVKEIRIGEKTIIEAVV